MKKLFILSLPRSGSTMLQRLLLADERFDGFAEPGILLPLLGARERGAMRAVYDSRLFRWGLKDAKRFSDYADEAYRHAVNAFYDGFVSKLLEDRKKSVSFFVDKTPRYAIFARQLVATFPDAAFVVLLRNPLDIIKSVHSTWPNRTWKLENYAIDFFVGLPELFEIVTDSLSNVHLMRYEEIIDDVEREAYKLWKFLGLEKPCDLLERFRNAKIIGTLGDPKCRNARYIGPSIASRKPTDFNLFRRNFARRVLQELGSERLRVLGYPAKELEKEIDASSNGLGPRFIGDLVGILYSWLSKFAGRQAHSIFLRQGVFHGRYWLEK